MRNSSGSNLSTIAVGAAFALAAAVSSGTALAQGNAPAFSVSSVECDWLDRAELTRLLELELALSVSGEDVPPLTLDLSCGERGVTIIVRDPERTQQIERTVPAPEIEGPGRERQIALTVAQFAGALWRLREAEEQEAADRQPTEEQRPAPTPVEPPPEPATPEPASEPRPVWSLELGAGLRGRALDAAALLTGLGELCGVAWLVERVGVVVALAVEGGRAERKGGSVGAAGVSAGLGLAGALVRGGRFGLDARLLLVGGYARYEGHAEDPTSHTDGSTDGGAGEIRIDLAPSFELGRFQLALVVQGGYALPVTIAVVRDDDDVSFCGWWVGAGLRAGVSFEG